MGPLYFSGDDPLLPLVDEVLAELPEEVPRFARKRCWFLAHAKGYGYVRPCRSRSTSPAETL